MAIVHRSLAIYRETSVFPPVGLEKLLRIFKPLLVHVITLVRPTNTPNLIEIDSQELPPHSGEVSRFCDVLFSLFLVFYSLVYFDFILLVCNLYFFPFPHLDYRSQFWTDSHALRLKRHVLFSTLAFTGFGAFKCTFRESPAQKNTKISTRFWTANLQRESI